MDDFGVVLFEETLQTRFGEDIGSICKCVLADGTEIHNNNEKKQIEQNSS